MSTCERCGATFHCAMTDPQADGTPCWCTLLPPAVPVPRPDSPATPDAREGTRASTGKSTGTSTGTSAACWCPGCLKAHIAGLRRQGAR